VLLIAGTGTVVAGYRGAFEDSSVIGAAIFGACGAVLAAAAIGVAVLLYILLNHCNV
jgi:hypothetical protein